MECILDQFYAQSSHFTGSPSQMLVFTLDLQFFNLKNMYYAGEWIFQWVHLHVGFWFFFQFCESSLHMHI